MGGREAVLVLCARAMETSDRVSRQSGSTGVRRCERSGIEFSRRNRDYEQCAGPHPARKNMRARCQSYNPRASVGQTTIRASIKTGSPTVVGVGLPWLGKEDRMQRLSRATSRASARRDGGADTKHSDRTGLGDLRADDVEVVRPASKGHGQRKPAGVGQCLAATFAVTAPRVGERSDRYRIAADGAAQAEDGCRRGITFAKQHLQAVIGI